MLACGSSLRPTGFLRRLDLVSMAQAALFRRFTAACGILARNACVFQDAATTPATRDPIAIVNAACAKMRSPLPSQAKQAD
jgi:hypothetical protein